MNTKENNKVDKKKASLPNSGTNIKTINTCHQHMRTFSFLPFSETEAKVLRLFLKEGDKKVIKAILAAACDALVGTQSGTRQLHETQLMLSDFLSQFTLA